MWTTLQTTITTLRAGTKKKVEMLLTTNQWMALQSLLWWEVLYRKIIMIENQIQKYTRVAWLWIGTNRKPMYDPTWWNIVELILSLLEENS